MGAKDMTEKYLESYNDVFSDIVNVLLFQGKRVVQPGQLANSRERAIYKADDVLHEEERDILKFWKKNRVCIAVYGFENQTQIDKTMPLRIMGYDGASYREQILKDKQEKKMSRDNDSALFRDRATMEKTVEIIRMFSYTGGFENIFFRLRDPCV